MSRAGWRPTLPTGPVYHPGLRRDLYVVQCRQCHSIGFTESRPDRAWLCEACRKTSDDPDFLFAAGRNEAPRRLFMIEHGLSEDDLRRVILDVWQMAEWPVPCIGERAWLRMFRRTGYISESGKPRPETCTVAWRGTRLTSRGRGMSWTNDLEQARWFAQRWALSGVDAGVFTALIRPHAILAILDSPEGRQESELIVNPNCLRGRESTPRLLETFPAGGAGQLRDSAGQNPGASWGLEVEPLSR